MKFTMLYDLIIIGGGPAGVTAGIYAARKKLNTLLITKDFTGQVGRAFLIENYPGFQKTRGLKLIEKLKKHLKKFEIKIKEGENVKEIKKISASARLLASYGGSAIAFGRRRSIALATEREGGKNLFRVSINKKGKYFAKAVIIASGGDPRPLEVPGEKEFLGRGVSYCVHCDAPIFKNKIVAVIGGGNAGFGAALDLVRYCLKVYILEVGPKVIADEINQEKAKATQKIEIIYNAKVKEIKGRHPPTTLPQKRAPNFVKSIIYQDLTSKKEIELKTDGVFIEIGSIPATGFVRELVDFNEKDEIKIDTKTCATRTPGIFAAGDVSEIKYKQIIIAAGEGAKAALSAYEYLQKLK